MPRTHPLTPIFDPEARRGTISFGAQQAPVLAHAFPGVITIPATVATPTLNVFNPIGSILWAHAYWAEGAEFIAQGYSNGAAVGTWPDEVGTADLTSTGSARPTYRSSGTGFGLPAVDFDGTDDYLGPVAYSTITVSHTVVTIFYNDITSPTEAAYIFDGFDGSHRLACGIRETNTWRHFSGLLADGGSATIAKHGLRSLITSTVFDTLNVDGANVVTGVDAGSQAITGLTMGARYSQLSNHFDGRIVFLGVYAGDIISASGWTDFKAWALSYYGVTLG